MRHTSFRLAASALAIVAGVSLTGCGLPFDILPKAPSVSEARQARVQAMSPTVTGAALVQEGFLTVGVDTATTGVPYCVESEGKLSGLDVDYASVVAGEMGLQVRFVRIADPASSLGRECDVVADCMPDSVNGATVVGSYSQSAVAIFHKGDQVVLESDKLAGQTVGVQADSNSQATLEGSNLSAVTKSFPTLKEAFEALENGEVTYVACEAYLGAYLAGDYSDISCAGTLDAPVSIGLAVSESNPELSQALTAAVEKVGQDGSFGIVRSRWFGGMPVLTEDLVIPGVTLSATSNATPADTAQGTSGEVVDKPQDGSTAGSNAVGVSD